MSKHPKNVLILHVECMFWYSIYMLVQEHTHTHTLPPRQGMTYNVTSALGVKWGKDKLFSLHSSSNSRERFHQSNWNHVRVCGPWAFTPTWFYKTQSTAFDRSFQTARPAWQIAFNIEPGCWRRRCLIERHKYSRRCFLLAVTRKKCATSGKPGAVWLVPIWRSETG